MKDMELKKRSKWAIDYVCAKKHLTNKTISIELGLKPGTLAQYRSGRIRPPINVISLFCEKYDFSEKWFYAGKGEPFPGARLQHPEICGPEEPEERPSKAATARQPMDEPGRWALEAEILQPVNERTPEYNRDVRKGVPKDDQYPTFPNSSFDLAKAIELAVRVLGSGTSYAYALYLNVIHFDRAILAESRIAVLEKKCEELEKKVEKLLNIADKVEKLEAENRELNRQLNLLRESREQSEAQGPAASESA